MNEIVTNSLKNIFKKYNLKENNLKLNDLPVVFNEYNEPINLKIKKNNILEISIESDSNLTFHIKIALYENKTLKITDEYYLNKITNNIEDDTEEQLINFIEMEIKFLNNFFKDKLFTENFINYRKTIINKIDKYLKKLNINSEIDPNLIFKKNDFKYINKDELINILINRIDISFYYVLKDKNGKNLYFDTMSELIKKDKELNKKNSKIKYAYKKCI